MPTPSPGAFSLLVRKHGHRVSAERGGYAELVPKYVRLAAEAGMPIGGVPDAPSNIRCDLGETTILLLRDGEGGEEG